MKFERKTFNTDSGEVRTIIPYECGKPINRILYFRMAGRDFYSESVNSKLSTKLMIESTALRSRALLAAMPKPSGTLQVILQETYKDETEPDGYALVDVWSITLKTEA
jgi:hypothetical protein